MKCEIGFHTNSRVADTLEQTLDLIAEAGFKHVMLSEKTGNLKSGLEYAKKLGLSVPYVHLAYRPPWAPSVNNIWKLCPERHETIGYYVDRIKLCHEYGVPVVVMHSTTGLSRLIDACPDTAVDSVRKVLDATEDCDVKIAFENCIYEEYLKTILDNIKDERVGFCYDCGHHYLHLPNVDFMGHYGDRCYAVHIHDNDMEYETGLDAGDLHLLPFDGKIDFHVVARDIANSSYDGAIMLEAKHHRADAGIFCYDAMSPTEFLKESYKRGEKLAQMLKEARGEE